MKKYLWVALLSLIMVACGGDRIIRGSGSGGGGFANENAHKLINLAVAELTSQLQILDKNMITGLPTNWSPNKMAHIVGNVESQPHVMRERHGESLALDYKFDGPNSKIYFLQPFFQENNHVAIDFTSEESYRPAIEEVKKRILHELGHIIYRHDRFKEKSMSLEKVEQQARGFAIKMLKETFSAQNLLCELQDIESAALAEDLESISAQKMIKSGFFGEQYPLILQQGFQVAEGKTEIKEYLRRVIDNNERQEEIIFANSVFANDAVRKALQKQRVSKVLAAKQVMSEANRQVKTTKDKFMGNNKQALRESFAEKHAELGNVSITDETMQLLLMQLTGDFIKSFVDVRLLINLFTGYTVTEHIQHYRAGANEHIDIEKSCHGGWSLIDWVIENGQRGYNLRQRFLQDVSNETSSKTISQCVATPDHQLSSVENNKLTYQLKLQDNVAKVGGLAQLDGFDYTNAYEKGDLTLEVQRDQALGYSAKLKLKLVDQVEPENSVINSYFNAELELQCQSKFHQVDFSDVSHAR